MNKPLIITLLTVTQLLFAQQPDQRLNQIAVEGRVELKQLADQASLSFSVKGVGPTLRQAVDNADRSTKTVTNKLLSLGVKEGNLSTSSFYSGDNRGDKAFLSSSRDFQAQITTVVTIDSLPLLEPILFAISECEVQSVSQVTFSLRDEPSLRRKARVEAALKAREKADDLAKTLGVTLGRVISIDEGQPSQPPQRLYGVSSYAMPFNNSTYNTVLANEVVAVDASIGYGFFAQTISIVSQVYVTFELK
ncbi:MAG TPA: SIMPL domain-containing protein [Bacteroidota bacterium]|nr:SIMPL domain-containing protein [Bacteroidota bacterium]